MSATLEGEQTTMENPAAIEYSFEFAVAPANSLRFGLLICY